jgi:hypothetical protein
MAKKKTGTTGIGQYTTTNHGLNKIHWSEREGERGADHDIFKNVNRNSDEARGGFSGPIKYGTDNE